MSSPRTERDTGKAPRHAQARRGNIIRYAKSMTVHRAGLTLSGVFPELPGDQLVTNSR